MTRGCAALEEETAADLDLRGLSELSCPLSTLTRLLKLEKMAFIARLWPFCRWNQLSKRSSPLCIRKGCQEAYQAVREVQKAAVKSLS